MIGLLIVSCLICLLLGTLLGFFVSSLCIMTKRGDNEKISGYSDRSKISRRLRQLAGLP